LPACDRQGDASDRVADGLPRIRKAQGEGKYTGRKKSIDDAAVRSMAAAGTSPAQIARDLGIARSSVYLALKGTLADTGGAADTLAA
jgi:DNA invertase Pin-like site-specific DNA recombinase